MKILYHIPCLETVYAGRFIYQGYKDAFLDLGHKFRPFTSNDNLKVILDEYQPDIFITSLNKYNLKFLDLEMLKKQRKTKGMVLFSQIRPWHYQTNAFGAQALKNKPKLIQLIKQGLAGDIFFHWLEQDDPSMDGFTSTTGYPFYTILLAANTKKYFPDYDEEYRTDISYVGSRLSSKKQLFKQYLNPLFKKYDCKVYGSDWSLSNRLIGYVQKFGQYFNIGFLKGIRKLPVSVESERKIYSSSIISLNIHEPHQRKFGSDFNERTLKIPASGGFQICDNVAVLKKYFNENELVIAENTNDWFEKIDYYIKNPEKRLPIIKAGRKKVLENHTYHHRVQQIIDIYNNFIGRE